MGSWAENAREYKRKQRTQDPPEHRDLTPRPAHDSKSKKVWRDRFQAARASLLRDIGWYVMGRERRWSDGFMYGRLKRNGWVCKRYRQARQAAKERGAI